MSVEGRGRRSAEEIRRGFREPPSLDTFHDHRKRKQRTHKWGAVLLAACVSIAAVVLVQRAFGRASSSAPARPAPVGGRILYGEWHPKDQHASWFTANPDGSGIQDLHLTTTCANWFPDGSRILITDDPAYGPGQPLRPAVVEPDGTGLHPLDATKDPTLNLGCGAVSPDGSTLALEGFNENARRLNGIYLVRASDGGGLTRLTRNPYGMGDEYPRFSPDGAQIAFMRERPGVSPQGAGALFVVGSEGTGLRRITPWGFTFLEQNWSPDGRWIAFQRPYGQLYLVHPDGTGLHRIPITLPAGSGAENPAWSPDGSWIVFSLAQGEEANIYRVRPDGTGLTQVTNASGVRLQSPDWGP